MLVHIFKPVKYERPQIINHILFAARRNYLGLIICLTLATCDSSPTPSLDLDMTTTAEDMSSLDLGDIDQNVTFGPNT